MDLRSFFGKKEICKGTVLEVFYAPNVDQVLVDGMPQAFLGPFEVPHYEVQIGNKKKTISTLRPSFEEGEEVLVETEGYINIKDFSLFEFNTLKKKN